MFELNEKEYTLEQIQKAAEASGMDIDSYIDKASKESGLIDNRESTKKPGKTDPTIPGAVVEGNAAPNTDSKPGVTSSGFTEKGEILLTGQPFEKGGWAITSVPLEEVIVTADEYSKKESEVARNILTDFGIPEIEKKSAGELKPITAFEETQRISKAEIERRKEAPEKPKTLMQSIANSTGQAMNRFAQIDDYGQYLYHMVLSDTDIAYNIFGEEFGNKVLKHNRVELGKQEAKLKKYATLTKPAFGFTDISKNESIGKNIAYGAGGAINAIMNVGSSAILSASTGGVGLGVEIIGQTIAEHNRILAQTKGMNLEQLQASGMFDVVTPLTIGALRYKLEKIGLDRLSKSILGTNPSITKNIIDLTFTTGFNGTQEWVDVGLETINTSLAEGKTQQEAEAEAWKFMTSKEGYESFLQGAFGSTGIVLGAKGIKSAANLRNKDDYSALRKKITKIGDLERAKLKKGLSEESINSISEQQNKLISEIKSNVEKNNQILFSLTDDQIKEINSKAEIIQQTNKTARAVNNDTSLDNNTKKEILLGLEQRIAEAQTGIFNIRKNAEELTKQTEKVKRAAQYVDNLEIEKFDNEEQINEFLDKQGYLNTDDKNRLKKQSSDYGFIIQDPNTDKQTIVINSSQASKTAEGVNVANHEFMHALLFKALKENPAASKKLAIALNEELNKIDIDQINNSIYRERLKEYLQDPDVSSSQAAEEALTLFSDALKSGDITLNEDKISDGIRSVMQTFGIKTKFNTGQDVIDFIRDINKSVDKGTLTKEQIRIAQGFDKLEGSIIEKELSKELIGDEKEQTQGIVRKESRKIPPNKVQKIYEEKGKDGAFEIIEAYKPLTTRLTNKYRDVPGFDFELLQSEIEIGKRGLLDLINAYDPSKGATLNTYVQGQLANRSIEAANRILDTEFKLDVTEAKAVTDTTTEETSEIVEEKPTKELQSLRKKMNISDEIKPVVFDAVRKTFGTKLPNVTEKTFKKELEKSFRTELKKPISKLFGKGEDYRSFLANNFESIYEALPQSIFNKRLKDFAEPVLDKEGKQLRERTAEGNKVFTKKKISKAEFIKYFLGNDVGGSTKGARKTAIVEAVAEAFAFDATMEVVSDPKVLEKAQAIAELQGIPISDNFIDQISLKVGRPVSFKFSKNSAIAFANKNNIEYYDLNSEKNINRYFDSIKRIAERLDYPTGLFSPSMMALDKERYYGLDLYARKKFNELKIVLGKNKLYSKVPANHSAKFTGKLETIRKKATKEAISIYNQKVDIMFTDFWNFINKVSNDLEYKKDLLAIYYMLEASTNEKAHPHRMGAKIASIDNINNGKAEWEHAVPNVWAFNFLINASLDKNINFQKALKALKDNYTLIALSIKDNAKLREYTSSMPLINGKEWNVYNDFWWQRYLNPEIAKINNGINPNNQKWLLESENPFEKYNSKGVQIKFSKSLSTDFNKFLELSSGVEFAKEYSADKASIIGKGKGKYKFFVPYSAEDFVGLLYTTLARKEKGDQQMQFYKDNLLTPFAKAIRQFETDKQMSMNAWAELKKRINNTPAKLGKTNETGYTNEQVVRLYIWNKQDTLPEGSSRQDVNEVIKFINKNEALKDFANQLITLAPPGEYSNPSGNWMEGTITTDMLSYVNQVKRSEYMSEWIDNVEEIFGEFKQGKLEGPNINKLRALYGKEYIESLTDILYRMKDGRNRRKGGNKLERAWLEWVNGSVGSIMFLNARSALLQTISAVNFINFTDNNPLMAAKSFANQKQFWDDFGFLFNSDFLKQRRAGLKTDVNADEIASAASTADNKVRAAFNAILKFGFLPTQMADSFAIAVGGASFYRNRLNRYVKEGMEPKAAQEQAFLDFAETAEESQQSSRPDRISMQQASSLGRVILAFANTPMQYARLTKKAMKDLIAGRGDWKTNVSKLMYYSVIQNIVFSALQQALFALLFSDEEDEKEKDRLWNIANGSMDTLLRGTGLYGAIASTSKNVILEIIKQNKAKRTDYTKAVMKATSLSPPINSKLNKLNSAAKAFTYRQDKEKMRTEGFSLDNPAFLAGGRIVSALTNLPADRAIMKADHLKTAMESETELWQSIALALGYSEWDLGMIEKNTKKPSKAKTFIKTKKFKTGLKTKKFKRK